MSRPQPAAVPDFRQSKLSSTPPPAVVFEQVRRRVAIAGAMAAKPGLLRFDDPTTGLDPIVATTVDDEIVTSRTLSTLTSIVVMVRAVRARTHSVS